MNKAHLTAISRSKLSTPATFLFCSGLLKGRVLDYGCGRGGDVTRLQPLVHGIVGYDPHWRPAMPAGQFDTIMCNFVLNVVPNEADREKVISDIRSRLNDGGVAYIAVRNDRKKLKGWTGKGTWQGFIQLPLDIVNRSPEYIIYRLAK